MTAYDLIQSIASVATAIGVALAAWQLAISRRQLQAEFEDSFATQYRAIARELPLEALVGRRLDEATLEASLRVFYNYFDLSNEQAFLARRRRLRRETWANWREGIEQHFSRPAFRQAWERLAPDLGGSFDDLKALLPVGLMAKTKSTA